jgi:hypothetical protein
MSTLPIEHAPSAIEYAPPPAPRVSPIDMLMVSLWAAMLTLAALIPHLHFMLVGFVAGGILIARHLWLVIYKGKPNDGNLELAVLLPIFGVFSTLAFNFVTHATPVTYDALLAKWDFGIASAVRNFALAHSWVMDPLVLTYQALPTSILLVLATTTGRTRSKLVWSLYLGAFLSLLCYLIFPAVGPIHTGDRNAPRNCMPSMHLTWTLLLWVNSKGWIKWAAGIFAALTAFATLATGEHYFPDLVAAVPWTWLITVIARKWAKQAVPRPEPVGN